MSDLDSFDVRILTALQQQGDLTQAEIAEKVHLSPSQCSRRVQRLRSEGYISKVVALVDPEQVGLAIKAYVMVTLRSHADEHTSNFAWLVKQSPHIVECCKLTGDFDFLLKVHAADLKRFDQLLQWLLRSPAVATVRSSIVLRDVKETTALPIELPLATDD